MQKCELLKQKFLEKQYESPIAISFVNDFMTIVKNDIEENVMKKILEYNIKVDKDELIKALNYDRQQYERGYDAGYNDGFGKGKEYYLEKIKNILGEEE